MSLRAKICQMVPTTFQGTNSGRAMITRQNATPRPFFGMHSETRMPSGTSIRSTMSEKIALRTSDARKRPPSSELGSNKSLYQPTPFQKN